jgi:hypothetical protein
LTIRDFEATLVTIAIAAHGKQINEEPFLLLFIFFIDGLIFVQ